MGLTSHISKDGFRLRGTEMSRIDGFSDVVFGFALTLIVVSLEVPKSFDELRELFLSFPPFLVCFVLFFAVWWSHFRFFRRYGLHDSGTIAINAMLLFTILLYVYPLKFLMNLFIGEIMQRPGVDSVFTNVHQVPELMVMFSIGFSTIYLLFAALYWNAWRQRDALELTTIEKALTQVYLWDIVGVAVIGLLVCALALLLPPRRAGLAGFGFFLIGAWKSIFGSISGARIRRLREAAAHDLH